MSNYVRNFGAKNYSNQTTIAQLIANNMSGCFFLKHGVDLAGHCLVHYMAPVRAKQDSRPHLQAVADPAFANGGGQG